MQTGCFCIGVITRLCYCFCDHALCKKLCSVQQLYFSALHLKDDRSGLVVMPEFSKDSLCRGVGHSQRHPPGIYSRVPPDAANCINLGHIKAYFHNTDSCSTDLRWLSSRGSRAPGSGGLILQLPGGTWKPAEQLNRPHYLCDLL